MAEYTCVSCGKVFGKPSAVKSHQRQKPSCQWVLKQQHAIPAAERFDYNDPEDLEEDPPADGTFGEAGLVALDDPFDFSVHAAEAEEPPAPLHPPPPMRTAAASAAAASSARQSERARVEELLEDDPPVQEVYAGAGKVYGWEKSVYETYQSMTRDASDNPYAPFSCRTAWEMAKWAKQSKTGDNSLTRLLAIPGVRRTFLSCCIYSLPVLH